LVVVGGLLVGAQPAVSAPAKPVDTGDGAAAAPGRAWRPEVRQHAPVTLPGTDRTITPFATPLNPTPPTALPGVEEGTGAVLKADGKAGSAVRRAAMPALGKATPQGPDDPLGGLYCTEQISRSAWVSGTPNQLDYTGNVSYLAEFGCNFWLNAAYVATGVIDRGRFNGQWLYTTPPIAYGQTYYGATSGGVSIPGEMFDGGRTVEIAFELFLLAPAGVWWGGCFPIPGLRYLLCEGLGTNLLHIVMGTGAFGTGLQPPVIRYAALGDSYSSGTGAPPYFHELCRRAPATYSSLMTGAGAGGLPVDQPASAACHGGVIDHLYVSQHAGVPPQLDAVRPNTRLVTLTIGGNDLGFSARLTGCYLSPDCTGGGGPLLTPQQLFETQVRLTALYRQIRAEMRSDGKLMVMSYPAVLPNPDDPADAQPTQERCSEVFFNLNATERRSIYQATAQVDRMIRDAVIATGDSRVMYVNGLDLFRGHRICSGADWANGVVSPLSDSFHPNAAGYRAMANQLISLLNPF
jgi:lysophospholipase L1-like esterase